MKKYYNYRRPTIWSEYLWGDSEINIMPISEREYSVSVFASKDKAVKKALKGIDKYSWNNSDAQNELLEKVKLEHSQPMVRIAKMDDWMTRRMEMEERISYFYSIIEDGPIVDFGDAWDDVTDENHPIIRKLRAFKTPREGVFINESKPKDIIMDKHGSYIKEGKWNVEHQIEEEYKVTLYSYQDMVIMNLGDYLRDENVTIYQLCDCCWSISVSIKKHKTLDLYFLAIDNIDDQYNSKEYIILKGSNYDGGK